MATPERTNFDRLKDAGLILKEPLPDEHRRVVDALTADEVDIVESIAARLDAADKLEELDPVRAGEPPFAACVIF